MQRAVLGLAIAAVPVCFARAAEVGDATNKTAATPAAQPTADATKPTLYVVGYAHLDTQWRWTYPQVVNQFLANTLRQNFPLFDKYPDYIFNFTGAKRYMLMKEYFPQEYERMKSYIVAGRWFPGGSSVDETDQNVPSAESVVRQILYGNHFFRKEFGRAGVDYMLPDCFGFPASLPSVLAHCGIKGFSTQKLAWGSAVGIPFNVGVWEGVDGQSVIAALNPGPYDSNVTGDLSHDAKWLDRINKNGAGTGNYFDFRYYGVGDRGGAPREASVQEVEKSVHSDGPVRVVSGTSDQIFKDITPEQREKLPRYKGELLLTWHSTGSLTSQAYVKRWNRKNELLADAAERASVAAAWLGGTPYPVEKLFNAWILLLEAQMHDILPGDCLPKAYEYSWNDAVLALNQFAAVTTDATGGVAAAMDTRAAGVPLVVYNPLAIAREDVVEATVTFPGDQTPAGVKVIGPDGKIVPSQVVGRDGAKLKILFLANVPSVSFTTFDVQAAADAIETRSPVALSVSESKLENARYRVTLNAAGDVASVFDKTNNTELLSAPMRLGFLHENPAEYPAWNMDWEDRRHEPQHYVDGPATVRVIENGPVRVALEVTRTARGSTFKQQVRLSAGDGGNRVEFPTHIDWRSTECSLEAVMPLGVSNAQATYQTQVGAMSRGNNNPKKYEVPQQQWLDLTDSSGKYGVSVLNDSKYGSDKPDDKTIRLTLLYTPGVRAGYQDEGSQDFGRHEMVYALQGHTGDWHEGRTGDQAARLNQPMAAFQTTSHGGALGNSFSLLSVDNPQVAVQAVKKAEDSDEIVVRVKETAGSAVKDARLSFAGAVVAAREIDGQEAEHGEATVRDGKLVVDLQPYHLRAYAIKLAPPAEPAVVATKSQPIDLPYDVDAVSTTAEPKDGGFDADGRTYPAEQLPAEVVSEDVHFKIGPTTSGAKNAVACRGQTLQIPAGTSRVYLLAASNDGDVTANFKVGGQSTPITVQNWSGAIGQWDNRLWKGKVSLLTYNWGNRLDGLVPGFIKRDTVAWYADHRRHPEGGNEVYEYCYLFKYALDVPAGATTLTLPDNEHVRVFAVTAASNTHDELTPARPLYDTLEDHTPGGAPTADVVSIGDKAIDGKSDDKPLNDSITVRIDPPLYWQDQYLRYTTDGSTPTPASPGYTDPIRINARTTVKAIQFDAAGEGGAMMERTFDVNDTTPPVVRSVTGLAPQRQVRVAFSEPVAKASAEQGANYKFDPPLNVTAAKLTEDDRVVDLTIADLPTDANASQHYTATIAGVKDQSPAGNGLKAASFPVQIVNPVVTIDGPFAAGAGQSMFEQRVDGMPTKAGEPWTINCFVKPRGTPEGSALIAGFGRCDDRVRGTGRYISWFPGGLHYWSRNQDVDTSEQLDGGKWQMLSAVFDGKTLTLYKNAKPIGSGEIALADDEPVVRLAPADPWQHAHQFQGEIRGFTVWPAALPAPSLAAVREAFGDK